MLNYENLDIRDALFRELYQIASRDKDFIFLNADTSAFELLRFIKDFPDQYISAGVSEQAMILVASGLAMSGKKVFIHSLIPFSALRCYEFIKVNICSMNLPITIIGGGAGFSFGFDGPTHHAVCDIALMRTLPEMTIYNPSNARDAALSAICSHSIKTPSYIRIDKGIYENNENDFDLGFSNLRKGKDICIISTGVMVHRAKKISDALRKMNFDISVIDLFRLKPINELELLKELKQYTHIITLEENSIIGGLGSIIAELIVDYNLNSKLKRIALADVQSFAYGSRDYLHKKYEIDEESVIKKITNFILEIQNA